MLPIESCITGVRRNGSTATAQEGFYQR